MKEKEKERQREERKAARGEEDAVRAREDGGEWVVWKRMQSESDAKQRFVERDAEAAMVERACGCVGVVRRTVRLAAVAFSVCLCLFLLLRSLAHHLSELIEIDEARLVNVDRLDHEINRLAIDGLAQS